MSAPAGRAPRRNRWSTCWSRAKLRMRSAAPTVRTTVSAISDITSARRARRCHGLAPMPPRPPSVSASRTSTRVDCQRGNQPEEQARADSEQEGEDRDPARQHRRRRHAAASEPTSCTRTGTANDANSRSRSPAGDRDQHALGEEVPDDAGASRAERDANGEVAPAGQRPRQQQAGDVDARDQQHAGDGTEQHEQRRAHTLHHQLLRARDRHADARVRFRVGASRAALRWRSLRSGPAGATPRFQPRDRLDARMPAAIGRLCGEKRTERDVDVRWLKQAEGGGQHADDRTGPAVEQHAFADDARRLRRSATATASS